MKKLNYIFAGFAFLAFLSFTSCSNDESTSEETDSTLIELEEKMDKIEVENTDSLTSTEVSGELGKEYTAKYVCPNRCKGSGFDKPGECPNTDCGMELMENQTYEEK